MNRIHPTALVDPGAQLAGSITVGPYAVIERDTVIGEGCEIAAFAAIKRYTRLGARNRVFEHAVIGGEPQDVKFRGHASAVEIGDGNVIREGVTIHRGSSEGSVTRVGNGSMLMAYCHVAHDCRIGGGVAIANGALLAGFVSVDDRAFVSGAVTVHQFCRIGRVAMVSQSTRVTMDCLPFVITEGSPARARGLNVVGLKRAGYGEADLRALRSAFHTLRSTRAQETVLAELAASDSAAVAEIVRFIGASKRGYTHAR